MWFQDKSTLDKVVKTFNECIKELKDEQIKEENRQNKKFDKYEFVEKIKLSIEIINNSTQMENNKNINNEENIAFMQPDSQTPFEVIMNLLENKNNDEKIKQENITKKDKDI